MTDAESEEWKALAANAARLDDTRFLKVYELMEQLGEKAPVRSAFDAIRPRLAELRPPRRPSASRLFFRPVEDLLDDAGSYMRRLNRISRVTLPACWRAIKDRIDPALVAEVMEGIQLADARDRQRQVEIAAPLWTAGSAALADVLVECDRNLKFKNDHFGRDDDVLRQLDIIVQCTAVGQSIEELKLNLPDYPIGDLAETHLDAIRQTLSRLGREDAKRAMPLLLVMTARMRRPGDLLKMLSSAKLGGSMVEREEMTRDLSGYVVGNLVRQTSEMASGQAGAAARPAGDIATLVERLTEGLNSISETVQGLRDKEMIGRVSSARAEISAFVLGNVLANADTTLAGMLFDKDEPASDAQVEQAEQLALAIRRCARLASHLGIQREVGARIQSIRQKLETETEQILRTCRPGPDGPEPAVRRQMFNTLRIVEILSGSEDAQKLYKDWQRRLK